MQGNHRHHVEMVLGSLAMNSGTRLVNQRSIRDYDKSSNLRIEAGIDPPSFGRGPPSVKSVMAVIQVEIRDPIQNTKDYNLVNIRDIHSASECVGTNQHSGGSIPKLLDVVLAVWV